MLAPCRVCGQDVSKEAKTCPHCGQKHPTRSKNYWRNIGIGVVAIVVLANIPSGFRSGDTSSNSQSTSSPQPSPINPKKAYSDSVSLSIDSWKLGGFDNVMIADFTITNKGSRAVKDFGIGCSLSAKSGTNIDAVYKTIYEMVPAGGKKRLRETNMGIVKTQVNSAECGISQFDFAE